MNTTPLPETASVPCSVCIIDDDDALRSMLVQTLEKAGFRTKPYASALEFSGAFDPSVPCCLLLDLSMPGMSGLQLQRWLAERGVHVPIVFLTGDADVPAAVEAMRGGAIDFLQKPIDRGILIERIRVAVAAEQRMRQIESNIATNRKKIARLTPRELQVCELLVHGLASKEIARKLEISTRTAEHHRASILRKIEATNVVELARIYLAARAQRTTPK